MATFVAECPACGHSGADQVVLDRPCKRCGSLAATERYNQRVAAEALAPKAEPAAPAAPVTEEPKTE